MLFNSYGFIFVFLPAVLIGFFVIGKWSGLRLAIGWLVVSSIIFYGWWNPLFVLLFLALIPFNFAIGVLLGKQAARSSSRRGNWWLLAAAVGADLSVLIYFKYANFFVTNINDGFGTHWVLTEVMLPLGISFFTFQKIAYLADAWKGEVKEYDFLNFCLFVLFFPQLIAGPIVHHGEVMPQFRHVSIIQPQTENIAIGVTIFIIGLVKKSLLADGIASYVNAIYGATAGGHVPTFQESWLAALGYTFQLYFDFSGYSDMAIGAARMFNIVLPLNFASPYKASNISEFWRRWHITLSRFLRDYLYFPMGGNRRGEPRHYLNLIVTMLIGGLWHGAGWTFVAWGGLHGLYLVAFHLWNRLTRAGSAATPHSASWFGRITTFLAVVIAWVLFRADDFTTAIQMLSGMIGLNGIVVPKALLQSLSEWAPWLPAMTGDFFPSFRTQKLLGLVAVPFLLFLWAVAWLAPNTQQIAGIAAGLQDRPRWRPTQSLAVVVGLAAICALMAMSEKHEFLYWNF